MRLLPSARTTSYAGAGVLAALAGTAAGHLTASLLDPASSPVLAVGSTVIDATPTPVKEWAIATFGSADKVILVGSVLVVTLVLAGVAGLLARRTLAGGLTLLLALVALAGAAAVLRPTAGVLDALPAVVTALVGAGVLTWFARRLRRAATPAPEQAATSDTPTHAHASRRGVLVGAGAVAVLAVGMAAIGQAVGTARTRLSNISLPRPTSSPKALPAGLEQRIDGVSPFVTPAEDFYRVDINLSVPVVDESDWTLTIDGDVDEEVSFTYAELLEMDTVEKDITLTCVSNYVGGPYVGSARWQGIPIRTLLDRAGIDSTGADQILSTSVDGFTMSTPLEVALDGRDTLLVVGMNGEPLPRDRGFPARLVTPGIYGYVGACKWITKMTLTTYDEVEAYWTERDWAIDGPIKISSRIDTPEGLSSNPTGEITIAGVAWAQTRGVGKVQVRIDGGAWQDAELGPDAGVDYWRQWFYRWQAEDPGQHLIACRAITDDGEVQTAAMAEPFPNGSSGIQEIAVNVS